MYNDLRNLNPVPIGSMDWSIYVLLLASVSETRILWDTNSPKAGKWPVILQKKGRIPNMLVWMYRCFSFKYGTLRVWSVKLECCSQKFCTNVGSYTPSLQSFMRQWLQNETPGSSAGDLVGMVTFCNPFNHASDLQWLAIKRYQQISLNYLVTSGSCFPWCFSPVFGHVKVRPAYLGRQLALRYKYTSPIECLVFFTLPDVSGKLSTRLPRRGASKQREGIGKPTGFLAKA